MDDIFFSYNWNKKLNCNAFSTIRIMQPDKYVLNKNYCIWLKRENIFEASIINITPFFLKDLTENMAYLDTGYSKEKATSIIKKMYPRVNFETKKLAFYLLLKHDQWIN